MDSSYLENSRVCGVPYQHYHSWWLCNATFVILSIVASAENVCPQEDSTNIASASVSCWSLLLPANNSLLLTLSSGVTVMVGLVFSLMPEFVLTMFHTGVQRILDIDPFLVEGIMHLILVIISLTIILFTFIMYMSLILLEGKHKNTLKPIKIIVPEEERCNPACTKDHQHTFNRRYSTFIYPNGSDTFKPGFKT